MARMEHFANASFRSHGNMPPVLFATTANGPLMFVPQSLSHSKAKDNFANTARLMCVAHAATAAVIALEAWAIFAKPGESLDMDTSPSEALERKELVVLMGKPPASRSKSSCPSYGLMQEGFLDSEN